MSFDISGFINQQNHEHDLGLPEIPPAPQNRVTDVVQATKLAISTQDAEPYILELAKRATLQDIFTATNMLTKERSNSAPRNFIENALKRSIITADLQTFGACIAEYGYANEMKFTSAFTFDIEDFTRWALANDFYYEDIISGWDRQCSEYHRLPDDLILEVFPEGTTVVGPEIVRTVAPLNDLPISAEAFEVLIERGHARYLVSLAAATAEQLARLQLWGYLYGKPELMNEIPDLVCDAVLADLDIWNHDRVTADAFVVLFHNRSLSPARTVEVLSQLPSTDKNYESPVYSLVSDYFMGATKTQVIPKAVGALLAGGFKARSLIYILHNAGMVEAHVDTLISYLITEPGAPAWFRGAFGRTGPAFREFPRPDLVLRAAKEAFGEDIKLWQRFAGESSIFDDYSISFKVGAQRYRERWLQEQQRRDRVSSYRGEI